MKYQLVFDGELTRGLKKKEAVTLFAELFGVSEKLARKRFFSGRVVLKNLDDFQKAIRYRERLRSMGIVVSVQEAGKDASPAAAGQARKRGGRKVLLWGGAVTALLVVGAAGLWVAASRYTAPSVPEQVLRAESALLTPETILLGHANIGKLVELEQWFGENSAEDYRYNPEGEGLVNALRGAGISPRRDLDQLVFSAGFSERTGSYVSAVFVGQIDPGALRKGLQDHYQVTERLQDELTVLELTRQDRYTCEVSRPIGLISNATTVVVSHPDKVVELYRAVNRAGNADIVNQQWVDYRSGHLASVGLLQPDNLARGQEGLAGMMLQQMSGQLNGAQSLFAGVSAELMPPGGSVDIALNSNDSQWVAQTRSSLDTLLSAKKAEASEAGGLTEQILQNISLAQSPGVLGARFEVDGELVDAGKKAFREGIGGLLSINGGGFSSSGDGQVMAEKVDKDAEPYLATVGSLQLPTFEPSYGQLYHWQEGPLAVAIQSLYLNPDQQLELAVVAAAQGIPNAPGSQGGKNGALRVTSVLDGKGQELIAPETCGREINSDPQSFSSSFGTELSAKKTVRLIPGASSEDIQVVEGQVTLPVATKTRTTEIGAQDGETTVDQGGMHLRVTSVEGSNVRFVVSGDRQRLLNVRGMNASRQYLERSSSMSTGGSRGGNKTTTVRFRGEVAFVEVVTAVEWTPIQHQFRITTPQPLQQDGNFQRDPSIATPYDLEDWSTVLDLAATLEPAQGNNGWLGEPATTARTEAGILSLFRPQVSRGFDGLAVQGYVQLAMPFVEALDGYQGRAVLAVNELEFADRQAVTVDYQQPIDLSFTGFENNVKDNNKTQAELRQDLYLNGQQQVAIPLGNQGEGLTGASLAGLSGELQFYLPRAVESRTMRSVAVGDSLAAGAASLQVIGFETGGLKVSAEGKTGAILQLLVLDAEGKQIGEGSGFSEEMRPGMQSLGDDTPRRMVSRISFNGKPASLRVVYVTDATIKRYPVTLKL